MFLFVCTVSGRVNFLLHILGVLTYVFDHFVWPKVFNDLESWFLQFDVVLQRTSIFKAVMILFVFVFMNTDSILF